MEKYIIAMFVASWWWSVHREFCMGVCVCVSVCACSGQSGESSEGCVCLVSAAQDTLVGDEVDEVDEVLKYVTVPLHLVYSALITK